MMHRTPNGQLVEINKMKFKNDVACFTKIAELKQHLLDTLSGIQQWNVYTAESTVIPLQPRMKKDKID
jgi:hypothetical protein